MTEQLLERPVAKKPTKERVEFQAESSWVRRMEADMTRRGLGKSAYIRQAVTMFMEQSEAEAAKRPARRRPADD